MDTKVMNVLRGVFVVVLGIMVCLFGVGAAVNTYFGIVAIVTGVLSIAFGIFTMVKKLPLALAPWLLGPVLITIAVALFMGKLSFAVLVDLFVFVVMGLGFALAVLGIIFIAKRMIAIGLSEIIVGALLVLFTALYLGIPDVQSAFLYFVGILMIAFGICVIVFSIVEPKGFKVSKQ